MKKKNGDIVLQHYKTNYDWVKTSIYHTLAHRRIQDFLKGGGCSYIFEEKKSTMLCYAEPAPHIVAGLGVGPSGSGGLGVLPQEIFFIFFVKMVQFPAF